MSLFALAGPTQVALPVLRTSNFLVMGAIRQLVTVALLLAVVRSFRPLVIGTLRALVLLFKPRVPFAVRRDINRLRSIALLNRSAKEVDFRQPNVAAELRALAARN